MALAERKIDAAANAGLTVADAVWVGTALLHQNAGGLQLGNGFSTEAIVQCVEQNHLTRAIYRSIYQHVNRHCVANRPPQPNKSCMLTALGRGDRRLYVPGDRIDEARKGAPTKPQREALPEQLRYLLTDYESWISQLQPQEHGNDPMHPFEHLLGTWTFGDADSFINELREGWD